MITLSTVETADPEQPGASARGRVSAIDGARFEVLPATGHLPQMETPGLVLEALSKNS
jgi:pimeloyl-ACP methyl ester carboxylesterase